MSKFHLSAKKRLVIMASTLAGLLSYGVTFAANPEPVVVQVSFVDPITITEVNALQFGLLDQNLALAETVVLSPLGGVTADAGSNVLGGTQAAAELTVTATAGFAITIDVIEVTEGTGYTLGTYMCNYDGGTDTACEGGYPETSVASADLFVGVTLTGDGNAVPGAADGSITVTITYI